MSAVERPGHPPLPPDYLRSIILKISKSYPACNAAEIANVEAEQRAIPVPDDLSDAIAAWTYIWSNSTDATPEGIVQDLSSLGLVSAPGAKVLSDLLISAEPFRESAKAVSAYLRVGAPLFVNVRAVIDIRCRFHSNEDEFMGGRAAKTLMETLPVVLATLTLTENDETKSINFLMDESDLSYLKRFVKNMEGQLELAKNLLKDGSVKS